MTQNAESSNTTPDNINDDSKTIIFHGEAAMTHKKNWLGEEVPLFNYMYYHQIVDGLRFEGRRVKLNLSVKEYFIMTTLNSLFFLFTCGFYGWYQEHFIGKYLDARLEWIDEENDASACSNHSEADDKLSPGEHQSGKHRSFQSEDMTHMPKEQDPTSNEDSDENRSAHSDPIHVEENRPQFTFFSAKPYFPYNFIYYLLQSLTLGLAYPWLKEWYIHRWFQHVDIDGKGLVFHGKASDFSAMHFKNWFMNLITLGCWAYYGCGVIPIADYLDSNVEMVSK